MGLRHPVTESIRLRMLSEIRHSMNDMFNMSIHIYVSTVYYEHVYTHLNCSTLDEQHVWYEERWGAGVEYHFQEFNEPYAPS